MTPSRLLHELEELAHRLGVIVRAEPFAKGIMKGRGGLCWVKGQPFVVMDEQLPQADRVALVAAALASFDLEGLHVIPAVREVVEGHAPGARRRLRRVARPGLARATQRAPSKERT